MSRRLGLAIMLACASVAVSLLGASSALASYRTTVLAGHPSAYWRFEDGWADPIVDDSGNGHSIPPRTGCSADGETGGLLASGSALGWAVAPDPGCGPLSFGDVLDFPGTAPFTLEAWARPHNPSSTAQRIFSKEVPSSSGVDGYNLFVTSAGFGFERRAPGQTDVAFSSGVTPKPYGIYHLVAAYDGATMRLYVNGQLVGTRASTQSLADNGASLTLGSASAGGYTFDGTLDEVAVYPAALAASQVQAHWSAGSGGYRQAILDAAPTAYWRFDDAGASTTKVNAFFAPFVDETGQWTRSYPAPGCTGPNHAAGIATGSTFGYAVTTPTGSMACGKSTLTNPDFPSFGGTAAFTLEAWVRVYSNPNSTVLILSKVAQDPSGSGWDGYDLYMDGGGFGIERRTAAQTDRAGGGVHIAQSQDYHVVGTYDGATLRIYVNGQLIGTKASALSLPSTNEGFDVGAMLGSGTPLFYGNIDEVAVYPRALSATDVQSHYSLGTSAYRKTVLGDGPAGYWRFADAPAGRGATDDSGNGHFGDTYGCKPADVAGGLPAAGSPFAMPITATGTTCYAVTFGDTLDFPGTAAFTLEAWVRPRSPSSTAQRIVSKEAKGSSGVDGYNLFMTSTGFGFERRTPALTDLAFSTGVKPTPYRNYHLVATYDGATMRLYVNDQLVGTRASTQSLIDNSASLMLGAFSSDTPGEAGGFATLDGALGEAAVYAHALTAAQVQSHWAAAGN